MLCCSIQFFKVLQINTVTRTTENDDRGRETRNLQTEVKIELFDVELVARPYTNCVDQHKLSSAWKMVE